MHTLLDRGLTPSPAISLSAAKGGMELLEPLLLTMNEQLASDTVRGEWLGEVVLVTFAILPVQVHV